MNKQHAVVHLKSHAIKKKHVLICRGECFSKKTIRVRCPLSTRDGLSLVSVCPLDYFSSRRRFLTIYTPVCSIWTAVCFPALRRFCSVLLINSFSRLHPPVCSKEGETLSRYSLFQCPPPTPSPSHLSSLLPSCCNPLITLSKSLSVSHSHAGDLQIRAGFNLCSIVLHCSLAMVDWLTYFPGERKGGRRRGRRALALVRCSSFPFSPLCHIWLQSVCGCFSASLRTLWKRLSLQVLQTARKLRATRLNRSRCRDFNDKRDFFYMYDHKRRQSTRPQ